MYTQQEIDNIKKFIKKYKANNNTKPVLHLIITLLLIFICIYKLKTNSKFIFLLSLLYLRIFIQFHDMCHKSYFKSDERQTKKYGINIIIAKLLEPLVGHTYDKWTRIHSKHHYVHGNLDLYDNTKTVTTKKIYNKLNKYQKVIYNIFRFPPLFFMITPLYVFWIDKLIDPFKMNTSIDNKINATLYL